MVEYKIVYADLPSAVKAMLCYEPSEDYYTIVVNSRYNHDQQIKAVEHELSHLTSDHFYTCHTAAEAEGSV